ncbi:MAG: class I SAM-dependent methyltransferase [Acetobacteraceae bacterium]
MKSTVMDTSPNRSIYERPAIVAEYAKAGELTAAEDKLLYRYETTIIGGHVLDLGVGAGRTTPFLASRAASYVGIDYSQQMIEACRQRFPQLQFRRGDARDLSDYASGSYDFVLFSFNGIDCVSHEGRMQVLREIARVLRPGGVFIFSSHNLDVVGTGTFMPAIFRVRLSANPVRSAKAIARVGLRLVNYARNRRHQYRASDHAILTDPAHEFTMSHYYVTPAAQRRQLVEAGFGADIDIVPGVDQATPYSLYYAATKAACRQVGDAGEAWAPEC